MTTDQNPGSSGTNSSSGGAPETNTQTQTEQQEQGAGKGTVAYETHAKLLSEKKKLAERLADLERKDKERADSELKAKEDYKKLLELREEELKSERTKREGLEKRFENGKKYAAFKKCLNGAEIEEQYSGLIDLDQVVVDPTTGEVDMASAQKYAQEFEKSYSRVIVRKAGGKMPHEAAKGSGAALGLAAEIKAAKTSKELEAVLSKYGKL